MEFWNEQPKLARELSRVHQIMKEQIPEKGRFSGIIFDLVENRGKMLRPALLLLCAGLDQPGDAAHRLAAGLEYLHLASLVHDDIIDEAAIRRGRPSVVSAHGLAKALYTGDYLIWLAVKCLSQLDRSLLPEEPSDFLSPLLEAEAEQLESRFSTALSEDDYLRRVEAKTGLLFAAAASAGLGVTTRFPVALRRISEAGLHYGVAFQLRDDLEDLEDPEARDLYEGNYTHPVLSALKTDPDLADELSLAAAAGNDKAARYEAIGRRVREGQGPKLTRRLMHEQLRLAVGLFKEALGPSEYEVFTWMNQMLFGGHHEN